MSRGSQESSQRPRAVPRKSCLDPTTNASSDDRIWSARSNGVDAQRLIVAEQTTRPVSIAECSPSDSTSNPRNEVEAVPYKTHLHVSNPRGLAQTRKAARDQVLSPPWAHAESCSRSLAIDLPQKVRALPGTMSTRQTTTQHKSMRPQEYATERSLAEGEIRQEHDKLGNCVMMAFKGIFRRKPRAESDFVRIGESHWTDD